MLIIKTTIASFLAILLVGFGSTLSSTDGTPFLFLIGSFGATAVMLFAIPDSPFSKPKNTFWGHMISAFIGVTIHTVLPESLIVASALSVSLSITLMLLTETLHPPGGATALIAIIGGPPVHNLGYSYLISPVLVGSLLMLAMAWITKKYLGSKTAPIE